MEGVGRHDHSHEGGVIAAVASHFPPDVNKRFFGALQVAPARQVYEGLEPDEQVILLIRRHPIVLLGPLIGGFVLALVPFILIGILVFVPLADVVARYGILFVWFLIVFTVYYFLTSLLKYMSDVWIVTNERIIDIDTNTIALKAASEVDLSAVAGASQVRGGGLVLGGIDRGKVLVRIIGEEDAFIPDAPMSGSVAQVIGELAEAAQRERGISAGSLTDLGGKPT